jgi:hypothetical protein
MAHDRPGGWFSTVRGRRGFAVCSDEVHPGVEMVGIEVGTHPCLPVSSLATTLSLFQKLLYFFESLMP